MLSQRFVQLFLLAGTSSVSLENAAVQLLGRSPSDNDPLNASSVEQDTSKLLKTKVRRLYDIANILTSLNLIEKVHTMYRKPAFKWLGPEASCSAILALRNEAVKRPASALLPEDLDCGRNSTKRRRVSSAQDGTNDVPTSGRARQPGTTSHATNNSIDDGLDEDTLTKIELVLNSFPDEYAVRWRDYVKSINIMLMRGQVSKAKAYESVATVLAQYKRVVADRQLHTDRPRDREARAQDDVEGQDRASQDVPEIPQSKINERRNNSSETDDTAKEENTTCNCTDQKENNADLVKAAAEGLAAVGTYRVSTPTAASTTRKSDRYSNGREDGAEDGPKVLGNGIKKEEAVEFAEAAAELHAGCSNEACANGSSNGQRRPNVASDSKDAVDKEDVKKSADAATAKCDENGNSAVGDTTGRADADSANKFAGAGTKWSEDYIESYMRKAKDAGPEYYAAAENWLQKYRNWEKIWSSPMTTWASMASLTNGVAASSDNRSNHAVSKQTPRTA